MKMSETLRRLVNLGSFSVLQEKIERWSDKYHLNTESMNESTCCEVIELNAQVQAQLFKILGLVSNGTAYGALRTRYPWYPYGLWPNGVYPDLYWSELSLKEREMRGIKDVYEKNLQTIEDDLEATRNEADDLHAELEETKAELQDEKRQSSSSQMVTEAEMRDMRTKLSIAEDELAALRPRVGLVSDYERQIRRLRDDIAILSGRRTALSTIPLSSRLMRANEEMLTLKANLDTAQKSNHRLRQELADTQLLAVHDIVNGQSHSLELEPPLKSSLKSSSSSVLPRPTSPIATDDVTQRVRQATLITRFNDIFAQDRLDAMETLRKFSDDYENNQRIVFTAMQEAFTTAKLAFANYKMRVRSNLVTTHYGPETLEEAVQDYINRNTDLYDLAGLVNDVIRSLNRNPKLLLPGEVTFTIIKPFVREACKLAWEMSALANPLDLAVAVDSELFDDNKYRRSYDSEYSAALVSHHIWPCLVQGIHVIMKGEGCTKRGSTALRRSRSPVRSSSPLRVSRARSTSPVRAKSPLRSMSPTRIRSRSPSPRRLDDLLRSGEPSRASSRAFTASTALSHYGVAS